ncbi:alpha/beta hydrolase [Luedemannella helvata]|uniref:Alpha/beta hydrolase n=1 Tax=Luedemannella helvata TaxID=349315 RepID=A0ABN2KTT2_9ACTN
MRTWRVLLVVLVTVVAVVAVLWLAQRRLIYFPDPAAPAAPPDVREVALETADGLRLSAWLLPPTGADRGYAVLMTPGNAGNRAGRIVLARSLADAGLTVLVVDYRGYGGNPGSPTEEGLALDARAGLAHLSAAGFAPGRVVYFGESLGAAVATGLAAEHPPAGLVLRSPFVDLAAAGQVHYPFLPVRLLLRDRFAVAETIARVRVPTVVIYGGADATVPPDQSRAVADRAAGPVTVVVIDGADHNDAELFHGPRITGAVTDLLDRLG